jgi:hypothetical protein
MFYKTYIKRHRMESKAKEFISWNSFIPITEMHSLVLKA